MVSSTTHHGNANGRHKPLRVLFVESQSELGGPGIALLTMLENVDRSVIEPVYVSLTPQRGELQPRVEALGLPAFHLPTGRFRQLGQTRRVIFALKELIVKEKIDLVFTNSGHPLLFGRPASLLTGRPCVWWVHGYEPRDPLRGHLIAVAEQFLGAEAYFANSEYTARMLRQDFHHETRIRVVRYGVDLETFRPAPELRSAARRELGIGPDEPVAGIFGRLQRWKGQHIFLQAAAILSGRGLEARFLIVGNSMFGLEPEYAEKLAEIAKQPALAKRVMFLGHRRDVNALMNACDAVVHASVESEPWGLVVAEGMAAGRVVIASAAGGPLEMIENRRNGLLVPPGDAFVLAAALEEVLARPAWRREMGEAARDHAIREYDPKRAAGVLCAELQDVFRLCGNANGR